MDEACVVAGTKSEISARLRPFSSSMRTLFSSLDLFFSAGRRVLVLCTSFFPSMLREIRRRILSASPRCPPALFGGCVWWGGVLGVGGVGTEMEIFGRRGRPAPPSIADSDQTPLFNRSAFSHLWPKVVFQLLPSRCGRRLLSAAGESGLLGRGGPRECPTVPLPEFPLLNR